MMMAMMMVMMMVMLVGVHAEECEAMLEATCGGILVALCRATLDCVNDEDDDDDGDDENDDDDEQR